MNCSNCGAKLDLQSVFCHRCGRAIIKDERINNLDIKPININAERIAATGKLAGKKIFNILKTLLILIVAAIAIVLAKEYIKASDEGDFWKSLTTQIESQKKKIGLPKQIDEITILDDMYVENRTIHYQYRLNTSNLSLEEKSSIKDFAKKELYAPVACTGSASRYNISSYFNFKYSDQNYSFTLSRIDCN